MNGAIINLELWFTYDIDQDYDKILQKTYDLAMKDIKDSIAKGPVDAVIGLLLCEGFLYKNNDKFYSVLEQIQQDSKVYGITEFVIIAGIAEDYQYELDTRGLEWTIYNWDFSVNGMYQSYKDRLTVLPDWNTSADKFLFLGGVPSRKNRITLLSKYYDKGLLDNSLWSFFPPNEDSDKRWCRNELSHYTDEQYNTFLTECESNVDSLYKDANTYSTLTGKEWKDTDILKNEFLNDPNYMDPNVFSSTCISILSEGHVYPPGNDYKFLTEKTWRAVINKHPFILACIPQRMDFIKSKGLRTFEKYMLLPSYAYIENYNERLDAIVSNTQHFIKSYHLNKDQILRDIEFNYNRLFEIVDENLFTINTIAEKYNIPDNEIDKWFNQKSFTHLFRIPE